MSGHNESARAASNQWEQFFYALVGDYPHFITTHDDLHRLTFANRKATALLQIGGDSIVGYGFGDRISSEARERWCDTLAEAQRTGAAQPLELVLPDGHGQSSSWIGMCLPVGPGPAGDLVTMLRPPAAGVIPNPDAPGYASSQLLLARISVDITPWVEATRQRESLLKELELRNQAIREHSQLLEAVLNSLDEGVTVIDDQGRVLLRNRRWFEITGCEVSGPTPVILNITHLDGRALTDDERLFRRVMCGEHVKNEEYFLVGRDGTKRQLVAGGIPLPDGKGTTRYVICTFLDVTEVRRLERSRKEFLHILSHDLRTPLAVVSAGSQLIQQYPATSEMVLGSAYRIAAAAGRMSTMIQDLLESAALETGTIDLRLQSLDLSQLVKELVEDHGNALEVDRIVVDVTAGDGTAIAMGDRDRIVRAVLNLVTNALKYSDAPHPVVIRVMSADGEARVEVIDQGVGIAREDQRRLFEPYYRGPGSPKGGLGLGLYIVKRLIEAHGGRVWITSQPGQGTCAGFALPLTK